MPRHSQNPNRWRNDRAPGTARGPATSSVDAGADISCARVPRAGGNCKPEVTTRTGTQRASLVCRIVVPKVRTSATRWLVRRFRLEFTRM